MPQRTAQPPCSTPRGGREAGRLAEARLSSFRYAWTGAAHTYLEIFSMFDGVGAYVGRILNGRTSSLAELRIPRTRLPTVSGKNVPCRPKGFIHRRSIHHPVIARTQPEQAPAESWLKLVSSRCQSVFRNQSTRPMRCSLWTQARLEQDQTQFQLFGLSGRLCAACAFSCLLNVARYFAEHAKSAERDYSTS
jgi:hypothetical protein